MKVLFIKREITQKRTQQGSRQCWKCIYNRSYLCTPFADKRWMWPSLWRQEFDLSFPEQDFFFSCMSSPKAPKLVHRSHSPHMLHDWVYYGRQQSCRKSAFFLWITTPVPLLEYTICVVSKPTYTSHDCTMLQTSCSDLTAVSHQRCTESKNLESYIVMCHTTTSWALVCFLSRMLSYNAIPHQSFKKSFFTATLTMQLVGQTNFLCVTTTQKWYKNRPLWQWQSFFSESVTTSCDHTDIPSAQMYSARSTRHYWWLIANQRQRSSKRR